MVNVEELTAAFESTRVSLNGVSFAGKALKLNTKDDAQPVVEAINNCQDLNFLNLEGNTLGVEASEEIAKSLETHPEFKRALWKDLFTGRMKTEIPKALEFLGNGLVKSGSRLTELDLSDNAFGPIGVRGLAALLCSPSCYALEELRLNNNGLGIEGGKLLSKALLDCYKFSSEQGKPLSLRVFIAGRNRLENNGAIALAEVFKTIGTLEEIVMPQNGIYHVGIKALSEAFKQNKNLQIINLNDNTIGPKGAEHLSEALRELPSIKEINFGDCLLKTRGAKLLAEGLKNNTNLEELSLGFNEIKVDGAIDLICAIQNKRKLKNLMIDGNHFGTDGRNLIENQLKELGKINVLGSLSENESEDSEDEDSGNSESEEDTESEDETHEEEKVTDTSVEVKPTIFNTQVTAEDFLKYPNMDKFLALGDNRSTLILNEAKKYLPTNVDEYIPCIMKVAAFGASTNEKVVEEIIRCCELLFKELFTSGHKTDNLSLINNSMLVNLGLIKSEDKKYKPTWNIDGCFIVIKNLVKRNYFPEATRTSLKLFLERENGKNETQIKKELLQTLN